MSTLRWNPMPRVLPVLTLLLLAWTGATDAASVVLSNGEPDPGYPDLRLWLRADAGVKDEAGRGPADAAFSGTVAAWNDQSSRHFDLTAAADRGPLYVARQQAAGNRPTVAFGSGRLLTRLNDTLHDQVNSTTLIVLQVRAGDERGVPVFCAGKPHGKGERFIFSRADSADAGHGSLRWFTAVNGGEMALDLPLGFPADGRFAVAIIRSAGENSTLELQDGLGDSLGGNREMVPRGRIPQSNQCGQGYVLGGLAPEHPWFYDGQIAEVMVYRRAVSSAEHRALLSYLRRKYDLDIADAIQPQGVQLMQAEDFEGSWEVHSRWDGSVASCLGDRHVSAGGRPAQEGIKRSILIAQAAKYAIWVRAVSGGENALQTLVNGRPLGLTHKQPPAGMAWRLAGTADLPPGESEIVIRGEGPGRKECDAVLVGPAHMTLADVEAQCAFVQRLRRMPSPGRITAAFEDGRRIEGDLLGGWTGDGAEIARGHARPRLRCVLLGSHPIEPADDAMLEFHNGDRLRGTLCGYVPASTESGRTIAAQLLVRPPKELTRGAARPIAVDVDWLRRIVFDPAPAGSPQPRSLVCRDGRFVTFRGVRFGEDGVSAFTGQGFQRFAFRELARIEMAQVDPWEAYYRQLSVVDPKCDAGLLRLETPHGIVITTSSTRAVNLREAEEPAATVCQVHPVWSIAPIPVAWSSIGLFWQAPAHVVPLSRLAPLRVEQPAGLGGSWRWQADRNVAGGELRSGGHHFLWGFGVHAPNSLIFALPETVRAFQCRVGIDAMIAGSGCAVAKVRAQEGGPPLFDSRPIVGSRAVVATGDIPLDRSGAGARQLVLSVESGGTSPPPGADPLDIGAHVDWLEPVLLLDPARLRAAVDKLPAK